MKLLSVVDDYGDTFEIDDISGRNGRAVSFEIDAGLDGSLLIEIADKSKIESIRNALSTWLGDAVRCGPWETLNAFDGEQIYRRTVGSFYLYVCEVVTRPEWRWSVELGDGDLLVDGFESICDDADASLLAAKRAAEDAARLYGIAVPL